MSRRHPRVSIDTRQNDTLLEFENFKKKFLLANKHITKLNSTLSVRIEELNAQISTLYVENLRLRASEIALSSQLKKERERSRKIIADAEAATHSLIKQLGHIRKTFNVQCSPSPEVPPPPPRAKRPVPGPNISPLPPRLARAPTFPGISEEDEMNVSPPETPDADIEEEGKNLTPVRRRKSKPRSSDPRFYIPSRTDPLSSILDAPRLDFDNQLNKVGKRKPTRRQSGLLTSMSITTVTPTGFTTEVIPPRPPSPAFGSPFRLSAGIEEVAEEAAIGNEDGQEVEVILKSVSRTEKERRREREIEGDSARGIGAVDDRPRERERKRPRSSDESVPAGGKFKVKDGANARGIHNAQPPSESRNNLQRRLISEYDVPTTGNAGFTSSSSTSARSSMPIATARSTITSVTRGVPLPTPRSSSPAPVPAPTDEEPPAGRERRVRKSINYAEPKLNTKMRKPDSAPAAPKRVASSSSSDSNSAGSRASPEYVSSQQVSSMIDVGASAQPVVGVKRKKSRAYVLQEDGEESEGAQADAEFGGLRGGSGWVNLDGRRRSVHGSSSLRRIEGDDTRRHSMAV